MNFSLITLCLLYQMIPMHQLFNNTFSYWFDIAVIQNFIHASPWTATYFSIFMWYYIYFIKHTAAHLTPFRVLVSASWHFMGSNKQLLFFFESLNWWSDPKCTTVWNLQWICSSTQLNFWPLKYCFNIFHRGNSFHIISENSNISTSKYCQWHMLQ